ncbi:hypothetical protein [Stackebrandtia nassauensis]|uniref:Uncharacterized protein n=1 Tax=Stackebrandtia nassauensis (strain DSM 44728 / CIP 108903 / NRRL B-16338 / NBRC 102104 / LLR-40K-21) TaxID=446470 RepID=D3Q1W5_STANL|nr:hypothetical protein [Stackebrandtia nassauensis]ADD41832.1 hypothetical protein Snas_2138 [Stackebrandtia nassauensis DSM 44728]
MGIMADRLASMVVKATSPDGQIEGELRDRDAVSVAFRGDTYRHYTEYSLGTQLSRLALRMWTGYQRGYDEAVAEATGRPVSRSQETWDANRRRFRQEQAATTVTGMSTDGWIYIQNTGMTSWHVVIRQGTLSKLDEDQFVAELMDAYNTMITEYRFATADLRAKHYGVSFQPRNPPVKELRA